MYRAIRVNKKNELIGLAFDHKSIIIDHINHRKDNQAGDIIEIYHNNKLMEIGSIDEHSLTYVMDENHVSNGKGGM